MRAIPWMLGVTFFCAGCELEFPSVPTDVEEINQAYEEPTGVLTATTVGDFGAALTEGIERAREYDLEVLRSVFDAFDEVPIEALPETSSTGEAQFDPNEPIPDSRLRVVLDIDQTCPGFDDSDATPGRVTLRAVVDQEGLLPLVWGRSEACHLPGPAKASIDGDIRIRASTQTGRVDFDRVLSSGLLVVFDGMATIGGNEIPINLDLRLSGDPIAVEIRVDDQNGRPIIASIGATELWSGEVAIGVNLRAADADFACFVSIDDGSGQCRELKSNVVWAW